MSVRKKGKDCQRNSSECSKQKPETAKKATRNGGIEGKMEVRVFILRNPNGFISALNKFCVSSPLRPDTWTTLSLLLSLFIVASDFVRRRYDDVCMHRGTQQRRRGR